MTKEEKNRVLAEWVGFTNFHGPPDWRGWICDGSDGHVVPLPDFYLSESASAMLLEKMPEPNLWLESSKDEPRLWACHADISGPDTSGYAHDPDRKTAIANSALSYIAALKLALEGK